MQNFPTLKHSSHSFIDRVAGLLKRRNKKAFTSHFAFETEMMQYGTKMVRFKTEMMRFRT